MEFIYFTTAGLVLYFGSSWILTRIEQARGKQFKHRDLVFFGIILVLSVSTFNMIQYLTTGSLG
ncbi:MAG: hypothetical protein OEY06_03745 [Gammaproteobacteria bacterium]|nr:hypothetical protein [Gammaproteobacteria bacterium]